MSSRQHTLPRSLGFSLVAVFALLIAVLTGTGSAAHAAAAENRVGASNPAMITAVEVLDGVSAGQRLGKDDPQPGIASATSDAAKTGGGRLTENGIGSAMEDILATANPGKASKSIQFSKPGGYDAARADFDALTQGSEVLERGGGLLTSTLSNGTKVNVRPFSSGKFPTLEIVTPGNPAIKIRY